VTATDGQQAVEQLHAAVTTLLAGGSLPDPASLETPLRPFLEKGDETYLRAVFGLAPATLASQVHIPTLIVRGGQDPALTEADTALLAAAIGSRSQVLLAPDAGPTLTITTQTVASVPTTIVTLPGGTSSMRQPSAVVTISRDNATLSSIAGWVASTTTG
jgi:pimeloyl-ACP methyl ester carboxylesterase